MELEIGTDNPTGSRDLKRRLSFILTSLGLRRRGFFTPYAYPVDTHYNIGSYPAVDALFETERPRFSGFIRRMAEDEARLLATQSGPDALDWSTRFIPPLDAAVIYSGVSQTKPGRIIEVGSGTSTHVMIRAIADLGLDTQMICIDPEPRVSVSALPVTFHRRTLSPDDVGIVGDLEAGDILFIDSSHILLQGMDCDILMNRIFPVLRPGVIVHVHDIFLPFGYPPHWRSYRFNEQQMLIPWLLSGAFKTLFASHYAYRRMAEEIRTALPRLTLITSRNGGSLWMQKA